MHKLWHAISQQSDPGQASYSYPIWSWSKLITTKIFSFLVFSMNRDMVTTKLVNWSVHWKTHREGKIRSFNFANVNISWHVEFSKIIIFSSSNERKSLVFQKFTFIWSLNIQNSKFGNPKCHPAKKSTRKSPFLSINLFYSK